MDVGFDLIEIHGAHGYLLTNFFSPHTNKRNDCYGGSLNNRMRIYIQIVRNIRKKIGYDFPLTIRLSGTDYEPDGFKIEDTVKLAKVLEDERKLKEVKGKRVVTFTNGRLEEIEADTVVIAVGFTPQSEIVSKLKERLTAEVHAIGDCVRPGKIFDAIHSAYKTALKV